MQKLDSFHGCHEFMVPNSNKNKLILLSFRFVIKLLKRMHKYRLTFAYYSITFLDFQSVLKTLQMLKEKKIEKRCPSIEIPFL